jgi:hypothetical protein
MKWSIPISIKLTLAFSVGVLFDLGVHSVVYDPAQLKRAHLTSAAESYRLGCVEQIFDWKLCTRKMEAFVEDLDRALY